MGLLHISTYPFKTKQVHHLTHIPKKSAEVETRNGYLACFPQQAILGPQSAKDPALHECFTIRIQNTYWKAYRLFFTTTSYHQAESFIHHQNINVEIPHHSLALLLLFLQLLIVPIKSNQISFPIRSRICFRCQFQNWGSSLSPDSRLLEPVVLLSPAWQQSSKSFNFMSVTQRYLASWRNGVVQERAKGCDVQHTNNKHRSPMACQVFDKEGGRKADFSAQRSCCHTMMSHYHSQMWRPEQNSEAGVRIPGGSSRGDWPSWIIRFDCGPLQAISRYLYTVWGSTTRTAFICIHQYQAWQCNLVKRLAHLILWFLCSRPAKQIQQSDQPGIKNQRMNAASATVVFLANTGIKNKSNGSTAHIYEGFSKVLFPVVLINQNSMHGVLCF